jgi:cysteinyl-tRNA synthetase
MQIYNTLSQKKETFVPLILNQVKMYVCGPTVYNYVHIGNGRVSVFFDVVRRYLEHLGFQVVYVQNITDVDDKIISAAKDGQVPEREISEKYTQAYLEDLARLNVGPPSVQPKVTEHMEDIILFIERLIQKEIAYEANGDVYYRVTQFSEYGKISKQQLSQLQHTSRENIYISKDKEHEHDFALWKKQKTDEIAWQSPWGMGRPGWHIECSAMAMKYLGETMDIHGGGLDLCFPHHENEIAQSEVLTGEPFSRVWMHNNFVTVDGIKMSKSLGNFTTIREALMKYEGKVLRLFYLLNHYRSPIDFNHEVLNGAKQSLAKFDELFHRMSFLTVCEEKQKNVDFQNQLQSFNLRFHQKMQDDFNTADAISVLFEMTAFIHQQIDKDSLSKRCVQEIIDLFKSYGSILGFDFSFSKAVLDPEIQLLIQEREMLKKLAKETKNKQMFKQADDIRQQILAKGIIIEDTPDGTRWKQVT